MKARVVRGVWINNKPYGPPAVVELTQAEFVQLRAANKVIAYVEPPAPAQPKPAVGVTQPHPQPQAQPAPTVHSGTLKLPEKK